MNALESIAQTLPPGYTARPAVREDGQALADLLAACDIALTGSSDMSLEDFVGDWEGADLPNDTVVVLAETGAVAAYADISNRGHVQVTAYLYVDPDQHGRGVGSFLADWAETWTTRNAINAPVGAEISVQQFVNRLNLAASPVLAERDYTPVRTHFTMSIDLAEAPPEPEWPSRIDVRSFVPGQDEMATHETIEDAFQDMWQRPPGTFEQFMPMMTRPYFDPKFWFLATEGETVVGTLLGNVIDGRGWIEYVAVRRPWRGRGLALAMLRHAFGVFFGSGVTRIGLSVDGDSPTGAPRIYARAGMTEDQAYTLFRKIVRPGVETSLQEPA